MPRKPRTFKPGYAYHVTTRCNNREFKLQRQQCREVFLYAIKLDKQLGTPRLLANQLFRSGTSIGANIAESRSAESNRDFISKQAIALKEAKETKYWLLLLIKSEIIPEEKVSNLLDECEQFKIIAKSIITSKEKLK
jgi:four helix bundle protein